MILYHTSDREIRIPDIHHGRKNADFGWGFYLTPDKEFMKLAYRSIKSAKLLFLHKNTAQ